MEALLAFGKNIGDMQFLYCDLCFKLLGYHDS